MAKTAKVTISVPEDLVALADEIAAERKVTRSRVFSACLRELAEKRRVAQMAEGYSMAAGELKQLAHDASQIEHEVLPEWR